MLDEIPGLLSSCILEYNLHPFFLPPFCPLFRSSVQWGQTNETNENSWKSVSRCPFALTFSREQPKFHCIVSCNFEQHKNTSCAREQRRIVLAIMNDSLHLHRHEEFISKSSALMLRCPVTVIYAVHRCMLVIWGECSMFRVRRVRRCWVQVYREQGTVLERLARVMTYQSSLAGPAPRTWTITVIL